MTNGRICTALLCLLLACFAIMVCPHPAEAQVLYGSVTGTVSDQSGALVPAAQVTITNTATGLKRQTSTDSGGLYRFLDLPEGIYAIDVTATGFSLLKKTNIRVVIGQVNEQDLQITVGAVTQTVTVQGGAEVLQTQKADVHTEISTYAIENLPVNSYRNFQAATLLTPGVFSLSAIAESYPNGLASGPERSFSIYSNGLPPRDNSTRVDGATSINIFLPDHMTIIPPQESIQEVNVQTATYDVEKGLTSGAATDVVTKSGTNQLHGSLYGFHSDNHIDARNWFDYSNKVRANIRNNDGGTVGGPIKKDKLFFFFNWDGYWQRTAGFGNALNPPQNYRDGNYNSVLGLPLFDAGGNPVNVCTTEGGTTQLRQGMVFDPATGNASNGTGRCVFSSGGQINVIPSGRIVQGAQNFWKLLRLPTSSAPITVNTAYNDYLDKSGTYGAADFGKQIYTGKLDWNRSNRHAVWGKFMLMPSNVLSPFDYGSAGGLGYTSKGRSQMETLGHTWTLSPTLVLTGHIAFGRQAPTAWPPSYGQPLGQSVLGIPGTNQPLGDTRYTGLPAIAMQGWNTFGGAEPSVPFTRRDWTLTTAHNLTWVRGGHEFRAGVDFAHLHMNFWQPGVAYCCPRGSLTLTEANTSINLPADPNNPTNGQFMKLYTSSAASPSTLAGTGYTPFLQNSVAAFDLGYLSQVADALQYISYASKQNEWGVYFGDRWKVSKNLTADLGLRWEYLPMLTRDGTVKLDVYDASTNLMRFGGVGGNPTHLGVTTSKKLFDPRIGLAYQVNDKMVVRAGFGIANNTMPMARPLLGSYPMNIVATSLVPSSYVSQFLPYTTFAQGIPLIQPPSVSSGSAAVPYNVGVQTAGPGEWSSGYVESWNFFVERRLPGGMLLDVGYVGNHLVHELNGVDINAAPLGGGSAGQPLYKYGRTLATYVFQHNLDSHYNSLQVSLNRHVRGGLFLQGAYTYSKAMGYENDDSYYAASGGYVFACPPSPAMPRGCQYLNYGPLSFDHTHMLKMGFGYDLPFGAGKKWNSSSRAANLIMGGWEINGVLTGLTGDPLAITQSSSYINTPGTGQKPNLIAPAQYIKARTSFKSAAGATYSGLYWFDPTSFAANTSTTSLGNLSRALSWLRGPGVVQLDASLFRHFKFGERWGLEVRGEAMNFTNSHHFSDPNTTCSIVSAQCLGSFGQITSSFGQRIIQVGMKVTF